MARYAASRVPTAPSLILTGALFVSGQLRYRSSVADLFNLAVVVDDDPDITLVRFVADEASYWDSHDSYVRLAAAFAKSLVTGTPGKSGNAGLAKFDA